MDTIFIEGLEVEAILGIFPEERVRPQSVVFDIEFGVDIAAAASSEDINHTVSYATVAEEVSALAVDGRYQLVETLAQACAQLLMQRFKVPWARVKISKPHAVAAAKGVGVVVERGRRPS
ncbi:MAG: dihydroneopterin aldolase [Granulosicoccaceae bacterium]